SEHRKRGSAAGQSRQLLDLLHSTLQPGLSAGRPSWRPALHGGQITARGTPAEAALLVKAAISFLRRRHDGLLPSLSASRRLTVQTCSSVGLLSEGRDGIIPRGVFRRRSCWWLPGDPFLAEITSEHGLADQAVGHAKKLDHLVARELGQRR